MNTTETTQWRLDSKWQGFPGIGNAATTFGWSFPQLLRIEDTIRDSHYGADFFTRHIERIRAERPPRWLRCGRTSDGTRWRLVYRDDFEVGAWAWYMIPDFSVFQTVERDEQHGTLLADPNAKPLIDSLLKDMPFFRPGTVKELVVPGSAEVVVHLDANRWLYVAEMFDENPDDSGYSNDWNWIADAEGEGWDESQYQRDRPLASILDL
ncbi:MAG: hypothetical protein AAGF47_05585 [Planctomycetota bacterium]